jgi:NADPH2:quinone reductase
MSRPTLYAESVRDLLSAIADGSVRPVAGGSYPLERAGDAHRDLLERRTVGKLVLDVGA